MRRYTFALSLAFLASASSAQDPGNCDPGTATGTLDVSDVSATVFTTGTLAYGPSGQHEYYVPKSTRLSPLYAASVWVGGTVGGEFRVAGATYGQGGTNNDYFEFWPGPLNEDGTLPNPNDCSAYDRVWVVSVEDVRRYERFGTDHPDLSEWPVGLGAPAVDAGGNEVVPTSRDQRIDLAAGERPVLYGSQTAFWVMNDVGNDHQTTESAPLGIEVAVTAFSIASNTMTLHQSTFLRYAITNRNAQPIEDARVSLWADPDLGNPSDDYVGVDTTRSLGFVYNADELDDGSYGLNPPAWGIDVLGGLADDLGQRDVTSFIYMTGGDANRADPRDAEEYQRVMRGVWPDGTPITASGVGYKQGGEQTPFVFPGDPVIGAFWSEEDNGSGRNEPGGRRFALSTGPGTIAPGETRTVDVALLFARGPSRLRSVTALREASDLVQEMYDDGSLLDEAPVPLPIQIFAAPTLWSPDDGAGPFQDSVTVAWQPVDNATGYEIEFDTAVPFQSSERVVLVDTTYTGATGTDSGTVYWRVRATRGGSKGPYSEVRSFEYVAPMPPIPERPSVLGIVEVTGPGGVDPCGPEAVSRQGCPNPGEPFSEGALGNNVYQSYNSTGDYVLYYKGPAGSWSSVAAYAPNDFEIRFTSFEEGSYGFYTFTTGQVTRVPFQIWDVGVVAPGEENDPSDDVRMIPVLFADDGPECTFGFSQQTIFNVGYTTQRIYAYYPDDHLTYEDWDLYATTTTCDENSPPPNEEFGIRDQYVDYARGRPLQRDVLEDATGTRGEDPATDFASLEGTIIRYYTTDVFGTDEAEGPTPAAASLGAPFPNPTQRRAAIPFEVGAPGPVRLAVVDVLGREVAVLVDEARPLGPGEAWLDASALAAGVYVVVLETEGGRASRTVTVVR